MKKFIKKTFDELHISDVVALLVTIFAFLLLVFEIGVGWGRDHPLPPLSPEFTSSSCKIAPELCKLEELLEKVRGER